MRTLAFAFLLVLAGCGGGSPESGPEATATTKAITTPTTTAPTGTPAPEALSRFQCAMNADDVWNASGYLSNAGKNRVTFQVTVYIGEAAGGEEKAKTHQVENVAGGGSVRFVIRNIPAPKAGGPCHVQVLASG